MAEIFRVLLVTLLLCLFWLPSGLSEQFEKGDEGNNNRGMKGGPSGETEKGAEFGGPKKVGPSDSKGGAGNNGGFVPAGDDENGKDGGGKSKDGDPPGYCRCNTAGRRVQPVVLGLFLLTFGVCLTWIEL